MIDDFCLHRVKDEVHVGVEQLLTQNSMWHSNLCFLLYSATYGDARGLQVGDAGLGRGGDIGSAGMDVWSAQHGGGALVLL